MKRKSITIAIAIIAGILIIQMMFWVSCSQEQSDQDSLTAQIGQVSFIPPEEIPTYDELAQRQKEAEESLAIQQELLSSSISSADVIENIMIFARRTGVDVLPLYSVPVSVEDIQEKEYLVLRINIKAEGNFADLLDFVEMLEDGTIKAFSLDQMALIQDEDVWRADMEILVYAQSVPKQDLTDDSKNQDF